MVKRRQPPYGHCQDGEINDAPHVVSPSPAGGGGEDADDDKPDSEGKRVTHSSYCKRNVLPRISGKDTATSLIVVRSFMAMETPCKVRCMI
jgi:hypothetical protein